MYDLATLQAALAGTIFNGKLHFSPTTGSTNTDAMTAGRNGAPHGSVFFTDEQTAGRGRGDHRWQSHSGAGLYVSALLRPSMVMEDLPVVPLLAGIAAANALFRSTGLKIDLRWPNDLLISDRKCGGILVESKTERNEVGFVVIGIGINVHQRNFDPGLSTPATSLDIASDRRISRQAVLIPLLESLEEQTAMLHDRAVLKAVPAQIGQMSTWLWNRRVEVHGPQACIGITRGLDEHGFLLVETHQGIVTVQTGGIRDANPN